MKKKLSVLLCIIALGITSCSDDEVFKAEVEYPTGTVENQLTADAWRSTHQLEIKADGPWHIETKDYFLTVSPESGTGDAIVTLTLDDNQGERRKVGKLSFIFEGHEEQNRELQVMQKFAGDYDDNAAGDLDTSNKIYAVGYSYDATGYWANPNSVRKQIFCTQNLIDSNLLVIGPVQTSTSIDMLSSSIVNDMTNALATKANVEGKFGKFKSEANASFDMGHAQNSNYEFASTYYNIEVRKASIETDYKTLMRSKKYLSADAYYAINGVPYQDEWTGEEYTDYPSTPEGFKRLIKEYGTHVIVSATLGGRVRHSMEVDVSKVKSAYDIKAFAQASYDGLFVSGGASVDEKYKQSYNESRNNIRIRVDALGGDEAAAKKLMETDGLKKENLDAWAATVTDKNLALVNFDQYSLVPIYELINEGLTEEKNKVNGKNRKRDLMEYMNEGEMGKEEEFSSYDCGTVAYMNSLDRFSSSWGDWSLVRTITCGGQEVAYICNEYIPLIDKTDRVTVVYPIVNNHVFFNKGLFIGDDYHKPATVEWNGTDVNIIAIESASVGTVDEIYIRGTSISLTESESEEVYGYDDSTFMTDNEGNEYGLVKILNHIWLQKDYCGTRDRNGKSLDIKKGDKDEKTCYYYDVDVNKDAFPPAGWLVPTAKDYEDIAKKLDEWNVEKWGTLLWYNEVLGYDAHVEGYYDRYRIAGQDYFKFSSPKDEVRHLAKGGWVNIRKDGGFSIKEVSVGSGGNCHVRLIKK